MVQTLSPDLNQHMNARAAATEPAVAASGAQPLTVSVHRDITTVAERWRVLEAEPRNSLHQSLAWCRAWQETNPAPLLIVEGQSGGRTLFLLPLEIRRVAGLTVARFIATRFTNINTGLFSTEAWEHGLGMTGDQFAQALRDAARGHADLLDLGNIPFDWRGSRHPFAELPADEHLNHSFQLPLFADFDKTIDQLHGKRRRKKYRNQVRKIEATGSYEHVIAQTPAEKATLLATFFRQKAARFRAMGLPDVFEAEAVQGFFLRLATGSRTGRDQALELHALKLHGEYEGRIAAICGLSRKGDHVICQFGSIDAEILPEASPGELLFWLVIARACREGATLFDFGLGDQDYKRRWCPVETVQYDILLPVSLPGRLGVAALKAAMRLKASLKANRRVYALLQRLRAGRNRAEPADAAGADAD